ECADTESSGREPDLPRTERAREAGAAGGAERGHPVDRLPHSLGYSIELPAVDPVGGRHPAAADGGDVLHRQVALESRRRYSTNGPWSSSRKETPPSVSIGHSFIKLSPVSSTASISVAVATPGKTGISCSRQ